MYLRDVIVTERLYCRYCILWYILSCVKNTDQGDPSTIPNKQRHGVVIFISVCSPAETHPVWVFKFLLRGRQTGIQEDSQTDRDAD